MIKRDYLFQAASLLWVSNKNILSKTDSTINICTDSRKYLEGDVFVAISGENFDATNFIAGLLEQNCLLIVMDDNSENRKKAEQWLSQYPETLFLTVSDTILYIQELANMVALDFKKRGGRIIALTGSNGKTTTKEFLRQILENMFPTQVLSTKGNLNNHLGVPFTLFNLKSQHQLLVLEMGTNHPGEIKRLCEIAVPDFGFITNIGDSHLEFFKNRENVFKEKAELYHWILRHNGKFLINLDDSLLASLDQKNVSTDGYSVILTEDDEIKLSLAKNKLSLINKNIAEDFNKINLAAAFSIALGLYPQQKEKLLGVVSEVVLPSNNRSQWIDGADKKIFLDAYNANPSSMQGAIDSFISALNKNQVKLNDALFILGDMNELGENSHKFHQQIGAKLAALNIVHVVFIGRFAKDYNQGFKLKAQVFLTKQDFLKDWPKAFNSFRYIFIKGSRSLQLESILDITIAD